VSPLILHLFSVGVGTRPWIAFVGLAEYICAFMIQLLLLFLTLTVHAADCGFLLRDGNYKSILKQIEILNPEILRAREPSPAQIYLDLKNESERIASREIDAPLIQRLRETQRDHFAVEGLDARAMTIFYRNALYQLEQRVASLWRQQEVRSLAGRPLSPGAQNFAEHLLDSFFSPNGLNDRSMTFNEAQEYFRTRPWMEFNWSEAIRAVELALQSATPPGDIHLPEIFNWSEQNRIRLALMQDRRPGVCCLSEPGCTLCPHNREVRKR
jgi:hypothetical protein